MNYKNMALVALLLPAFCYSQTKEDRIKELENDQREELLKIKEIENKIIISHKLIDYVNDNGGYQLDHAIRRKLRTSKGSDADKEQIREMIISDMGSFADHLHQAICDKGIFDCDLTRELFADELDELDDFCTLRFFALQVVTERLRLKHLVASYQECLHELIAISKKLIKNKENK